MATKRGDGAEMEPTSGTTRKTTARSGGGGAGRSGRGAAKPDGPTAETGSTGRGTSGRSGAGKSATTKAATGAKARSGGTTRGGAGAAGATRKAAGGRKPDLRKDLRDFASSRPQGWSHDDWLQFLDHLQSRGHNIGDRDAIGSMLERERLALALERIPGVGPQRIRSIADRYGYLWRLRETDADQLSREAEIPRPVAEKVLAGLRS
jgi:hypothetical protein